MDGLLVETHPAELASPWAHGVVRLYYQTRAGMGGQGLMLEGGGLYDEPAIMVDAFGEVARLEAAARPAAKDDA